MVHCPHTFSPQVHELILDPITAKIIHCGECCGSIKMCNNQNCKAYNRYVAEFCTTCGDELKIDSVFDETKLVSGVHKRIDSSSEYQLSKLLGNNEEDEPLFWLAGYDGVFIFTHDKYAKKTPPNLYYIPNYKFQQGVGKRLPSDTGIPVFTQWVQLPEVSKQGLFIPTNKSLHYFPAHGSDKKYEHKVWGTSKAETILSIAIGKSGNPSILVKNSDNKLVILEGNTQSGIWGAGNHRYELGSNAGSGTAYLITADNSPNDYWIYNGTNLIHYETKARGIVSEDTIKEGVTMPLLLNERIEKGYFRPFVTENDSDPLKFVIPILPSSSANVVVGILPKGNCSPRRINDGDQRLLWIKPYATGEGFSVGFAGYIKGFVGSDQKWEIKKDNVESLPPVMMPRWIAVLTSAANNRIDSSPTLKIMFEPVNQDKGVYIPDNDQCRSGDITKKGTAEQYLPPLYFDGNLFFAITSKKITTVYITQVSA